MKTVKAKSHTLCIMDDARYMADIEIEDRGLTVELGYINSRGGFTLYGIKEWNALVQFINDVDTKIKDLSK